jgi:glycosyltransferase involved in cell wall biosynthesis
MERRTFKMLSIVVPVYNEDRYLELVNGKVIAQPLPEKLKMELILVNDASQDAT